MIQNTETEGNRIHEVKRAISEEIFKNICLGLFNKDKRVFSMNIAIAIGLNELKTI